MTAVLRFDNEKVDLAMVTTVNDTFQKSVMVTPIVTLPSDFAFPLETGSGEELTLSFERVSPSNPNDVSTDSTKWSNARWYTALKESVDRWQVRTDGFELDVIPSGDNPYIPERKGLNGYVGSLTLLYRSGDNTRISGKMSFSVGTMYVRNAMVEPVTGPKGTSKNTRRYEVLMSDATENRSWYHLLSAEREVDCIQSYNLTGGLESPFEILTMTIPKDKLNSVAPELVNGIVAGRNRVMVDAVGKCTSMTVTSVKLSGNRYRITAYGDAARVTGYNIRADMMFSPIHWVREILTTGRYGVTYEEGETLIIRYDASRLTTRMSDTLRFPKGTGAWRILQVAAMYMGCKVMFAEDKAYVVDLRIPGDRYLGGSPVGDFDVLDLYDTARDSPMFGRLTGSVTFGGEGDDTIINRVDISCRTSPDSGEDVKKETKSYTDSSSVAMFGERSATTLDLPELIQNTELGYNQAATFAGNYMDYRDEPQQSVGFTLKEVRKTSTGPTWESAFPPLTRALAIRSVQDGFIISSRSVITDEPLPQKLMLSTYTRNYPEGTTTYNFGVITPVDLSGSLGGITQNMGV